MPKINHLLIEEDFVSISPLNNLTRNEVNQIAEKFSALGIEYELFDDTNEQQAAAISPYDLRITVNRDLKHRIILEVMADYGWISEELMNKYEPHIKRAEAALEMYLNTRDEITPAQVDLLKQMMDSDVEEIIDKSRNRKHAEFILKLCRYSPDADYVTHQLWQTCSLPCDVTAIKASLRTLNKIYFLDAANSKALFAQGGFVPDVKQVRKTYLEFTAGKLDEKFEPAEPLTDEELRRTMYIELQFVDNVNLLDHLRQNELIKEVNGLFPDLKPMPLWPVTSAPVRATHASFFATNKQQESSVDEKAATKYLNM